MELKRKKLNIKLDGNEHEVSFPTVKQFSEYQKELKDSEGKEIDLIVNFLDKLGLKKEISEGLEMDHMTQIIDALGGQKKT